MKGAAVEGGGTSLLDDHAAVHDDDVVGHSGHDAEVVGYEEYRHACLLLKPAQEVQDLRLDRDVERRGRLVGYQDTGAAGEGHRDHDPLLHAARHLVRIVVHPYFGRGDAHLCEHIDRLLFQLPAPEPLVDCYRLPYLIAHGEDRIEGAGRFLKDHRYFVPADISHPGFGDPQEVHPVIQDGPVRDLAGGRWYEPEDREGADRLPASALADQAKRLARAEPETHSVDSPHGAALNVKGGPEVPYIEEGHCRKTPSVVRGAIRPAAGPTSAQ